VRAGRALLLALALPLAGCGESASRPAAAPSAEPAATPTPSPSVASVAQALGAAASPAETAFRDAVTAVVRSRDVDDPDAPIANPDHVFVPLRRAGLAGPDFDGEADYYAWVAPRGPLRFLGHDVALVIAEEMRAGFIGCCVSEGVTLVLAPAGDRKDLEQFAAAERCKLEPASRNTRFEMATEDRPALRGRSGLVALSCHEWEMME
jgi:hypothetical protein